MSPPTTLQSRQEALRELSAFTEELVALLKAANMLYPQMMMIAAKRLVRSSIIQSQPKNLRILVTGVEYIGNNLYKWTGETDIDFECVRSCLAHIDDKLKVITSL